MSKAPDKNKLRRPEGPYETGDLSELRALSNVRISKLIEFVEQFENEFASAISVKQGYDETQILTRLMKDHLAGRLTTTTSLAAYSGLTYGTALRAIASIEERGLLQRRQRTETGKSFSLHPSQKLILEWHEFARRLEIIINVASGSQSAGDLPDLDYYFGSSYANSAILPPTPILGEKLPLSKGLRMLVHADPTFMAMNRLKKQFESNFGVEIQIRALSIDRLREEILENATRPQSRYDIIASDLPWFGEMADAGHFLKLDRLISDDNLDLSDFYESALASTRFQGSYYGLPLQAAPELLICRRDMFADLGLEPPKTSDDLLDTARFIHRRVPGVSGIAWNAAKGTPLGHSFAFLMASFGQPILNLSKLHDGFDGENMRDENFRPMFNTPVAHEVCEYMTELLSVSPPGILSMTWFERARAYAEGRVGMAYANTLLAPIFESHAESPAYMNTEYIPIPAGPAGKQIAPVGGYALAIPNNLAPERIYPIWTALSSFISAESIKMFVGNGSLVSPRVALSRDPEISETAPLISIVDDMSRSGLLQMWPRPSIPGISEVFSIAGEELHGSLAGAITIESAMENAQNRADKIMRVNGHY